MSWVKTITCRSKASSTILFEILFLHLWSREETGSSKIIALLCSEIDNSDKKVAKEIHLCSPSLKISFNAIPLAFCSSSLK